MTGLMIVFGYRWCGEENAWAGFEDLFYNVMSKLLGFVNELGRQVCR
jgi:hypothetical protein